MSEPVVTVFRMLGRQEPESFGVAADQSKWDLLIQPLMVREGSDATDKELSKGLEKSPSPLRAGPGKASKRL